MTDVTAVAESRPLGARARRRTVTRFSLLVADVLALAAGSNLATILHFGQWRTVAAIGPPGSAVTFFKVGLGMTVVWLAMFWVEGLYDLDRVGRGTREYTRVLKAIAMGVAGFSVFQYALKLPDLSRLWMLMASVLAGLFVVLGRAATRSALQWVRQRGSLTRPVLVVGDNAEAAHIMRVLAKSRRDGLTPVGCLTSSRSGPTALGSCVEDVPRLGTANEITEVLSRSNIDTVVFASTAFEPSTLSRMIEDLRGWDGDIQLSAGLLDVSAARVLVHEVAGIPLITVRGVAFTPTRRLAKRAFDLAVAGTVILLGIPVWLTIAAAIKLDSPGPVFFRQRRVGLNGEPFDLIKFRSMRSGVGIDLAKVQVAAVSANIVKLQDDPRVTRVGRILRRHSLDEFPQLVNVVRGEMSLVGPRPEQACEVERYAERHARRLDVLPGMTGLWQVSGRSDLSVEEKMRLDLYYVENWSLMSDVGLLLRTLPVVLLSRGAY